MKNLVIFHLESVSSQVLNSFRGSMPVLWRLISQSIYFQRFFSTATSSNMAISDLMRGENCSLDGGRFYWDIKNPAHYQDDLFSILKQNGYNVGCAIRYMMDPGPARDGTLSQTYQVMPDVLKPLKAFIGRNEFESTMGEICGKQPFALYLYDISGHINGNFHQKRAEAASAQAMMVNGYKKIDETLTWLLEYLTARGLWNDTIIIGFGDHGDSLYSHGLQHGMCHGGPPRSNLIWTPFFIHNGSDIALTDALASILDVRQTVLAMLGYPEYRVFELSGINLLAQGNQVVFSQNLYANQCEEQALYANSNWEKGYAATNLNYTLVVTAQGMEFYAYPLDPSNSCNLLRFFSLDKDGNITAFNRPSQVPPAFFIHFNSLFPEDFVREMAANFQYLKAQLVERIRVKERFVGARGIQERFCFPFSAFTRIRETYW